MALFAYRGRRSSGELVEGVVESPDSAAVATQLLAGGVVPVDIGPAKARGVGLRWRQERVMPQELLLFSRQMYTLLKAGVPIMRALAGLQESTANPAWKAVLQGTRDNLESGRELSVSMQRQGGTFSPFYLAMVRVGEMTGTLEEIFLRLFHHLEFQEYMRNQVKSALRYPAFVLAAMAVAIVIVNLFVIPAFAKVYKGFNTELPLLTRVLIGFSDFMIETWPLLLAGFVGAIFAARAYVRTPDGRYGWDRWKLLIPVAGPIIQKATLARFSRSFALALKSGVPVVQALTLTAQVVDNAFIARRIEDMRTGVERGESVLRTAVASGVFTPVVLQMVAVGEESGALDDLMREVADMYQREVEYDLKNLGSQIEPILIVCLGVLVLILALGVFLPIWDLGHAVLGKK